MVCVLCVLFFSIIYFELIFSLSFFLFCFLEMSVLGFSCLDHNFCTRREARTQSLLPSPPGLLPERVPLGPRDPLVSPRRTDSETRSCRLPCSTWPRAHSPSRTSLPSGATPRTRDPGPHTCVWGGWDGAHCFIAYIAYSNVYNKPFFKKVRHMKSLLCKFHVNLKLLWVNTSTSTTELEPSGKAHDKFYTCRIPEAFSDLTLWHN